LNELWLKEFNILNSEKDKINDSKTNLSIEVTFKGSKKYFLDKIREIIAWKLHLKVSKIFWRMNISS